MTQRKLAERIVLQANKCGCNICCLCKNYQYDTDKCKASNTIDELSKVPVCIEGVRDWLIDWRSNNVNE